LDGYKYALVGGMINDNEKPRQAALRELLEETGLVMENPDEDLVSLGKYRVQV
jgi:ADP-ribose pyrophosphatase YjhB (NUDIX family)